MLDSLRIFAERFYWLKVYLSPFKKPNIKFYFGKVAVGTPYFLPRKWVKFTPQDAVDKAVEYVNDSKYVRKPFIEWYNSFLRYRKPVPKKIGFDFVPLGWKTKWTGNDYRFENSPVWSFVFFGYQIAITFVAPEMHHYWECWLYYSRETKGKTKDRLIQARKEFPCVWITHYDKGTEKKICYWDIILKDKWL
jgi:hypothetical protein